jgi:hypothetical protein
MDRDRNTERALCIASSWLAILVALVVLALPSTSARAGTPVKVRLVEGNSRGFLVLRALNGEAIAHGELMQRPRGARIESQLVLNFKDGSLRDERVTFSQNGVFRVEAYRLLQRGPSCPFSEISFDRQTGRFEARTQQTKSDEIREASGAFEMPADLYNGMAPVLLKNIPPGSPVSVQMAVFTPKPRLLEMKLISETEDVVRLGASTRTVRRYLVKLEVGGLTGVLASLVGKDPPDVRYWMVTGEVPAFVRFQGAMFLKGPIWRLELTTLELSN